MNEETLFQEALSKSPEERVAFLDRACEGRPELRASVEALLSAHDKSGHILDRPQPDLSADPASVGPQDSSSAVTGEHISDNAPSSTTRTTDFQAKSQAGAVIAERYTLLEEIGEGGMGVVWVAKQTEPVKRKVALKLIKTGMDSRAVLARFEQERQALAMMDHPNISKVLDAGLTPGGQPFFVMELVNGLPLTIFCDEARLTTKDRLELFVSICQAVQHAHQKGIVHRDLKPANILVTIIDGRPVPKVIDFGVAKATAGKLTDQSMSTQFGAIVGTLEYMSPEQAGFSGTDIDTRADIYSLGVILYELLTGLRPIDARRLKRAALTELIRIIQEEEPSKPSTRLSTDDSLPSMAALRQIEPRRLMALLRGELDWVVMKCLEKQRERRYDTANALARDIQRYLADEAVEARPPSSGYRFRKFLKRHKGAVVAASLVLFALLAGIAGTSFGLIRAEKAYADEARQRHVAEVKEQEAQSEKEKAIKAAAAETIALEKTRRRLGQIEKGIDLLASLLKGINPRNEEQGGPTLYEQLRKRASQAVDELDAESVGDPLAVARLQAILGQTLRELGDYPRAIAVFEKAFTIRQRELGDDHPDTLSARSILASARYLDGQLDRAIPILEQTLKAQEAKLGDDHLDCLSTRGDLALAYLDAGKRALALTLLERNLKMQEARQGDDHPATLSNRNNLALVYRDAGKLDLAIPLLERTLKIREAKLGEDHADTLNTRSNLALAYQDAGRLGLAIPLLTRTLAASEAKLGDDHPKTLTFRDNLAVAYQLSGKQELAIPLLERNLKESEAKLGKDHESTVTTRSNLANAYQTVGKVELAVPLFELTLKTLEATLGDDHPKTLVARNNLALAYSNSGKMDLAIPLLERTLKAQEATLGDDHSDTLASRNNLASLYSRTGKLDRTITLLERTLKICQIKMGEDHPATLTMSGNLANTYIDIGRFDLALPLLESTLKAEEAKLGRDHPKILTTRNNLSSLYLKLGREKEGLALAEQSALGVEKLRFRHEHAHLIIPNTSSAYETAKQFDKAETWRRKWLEFVRQQAGPTSMAYFEALGCLGTNLYMQQKWEAAEVPLRENLAIREKMSPDDARTFNTKRMLGGALLGQKKYTEAEPLLVAGYEGMKLREATIPPQAKYLLTEALERLVQLYEATNRPVEATRWRKELEASKPAETPKDQK